ncbi:MAG: glycosyltransferase [Planctomycetota bacterium]|nr:glycosyltransferase [Planctomycetota bacterium]
MRLAIDATAYGPVPGGAGLRMRALAARLAMRHRVEWFAARDALASLAPEGVAVTTLDVAAARPVRRFLAQRHRVVAAAVVADHYAALTGAPVVLTLHDRGGPWWRRALIRRGFARAAAVVAVSKTVARAWGVDATVIPNGVAAPATAVEPSAHLLLCDPGPAHKDAPTARAAAHATGRALREVGRGVAWLDHGELRDELARAAVVLCPARDEGFGMVPLEALAAGRPVVASDIAAHREILGEHAWFAPPGDVGAWSRAIEQALDAEAPRLARARAHAATFSWDAAVAALEAVLVRV